MTASRERGLIRAVTGFLAGCAAAAFAASASAQTPSGVPWISHEGFPEPLYLVVCLPTQFTTPCPGDGMALVPDPSVYRNLSLRVLGGPFTQRWQVENMRASLIRGGMPLHSMFIYMVDRNGATTGGFWMGSMPACTGKAGAPLTGSVTANLSPADVRPEAMPVTEDAFTAYQNYYNEILEECRELERIERGDTASFGTPPAAATAAIPSDGGAPPLPPEIQAQVRSGPETYVWKECWGPPHGTGPCTVQDIPVYHYTLNNGSVYVDRRRYEQTRARLSASGLWFHSSPTAPVRE